MNMNEINLRDPFIMKSNAKYYLYGTRSATTWGLADGFDCYESENLENWDGPFEIYKKSEGSDFDRAYWAPECYEIGGKYYLIATLGSEHKKKSVYALISNSPKGPFVMHSDRELTPEGWCSIDGTLHFEKDKIYLIFSHSFEDTPNGDMVAIQISHDLKQSIGEPFVLFDAVGAPWSKPVPFAKKEFHMDGDVYFTDGPCTYQMTSGELLLLWSSWSDHGYAVGIAVSKDKTIHGKWHHMEEKFFPQNGGHGMLFQTYEGQLKYLLHYPNDRYLERPFLADVIEIDDSLRIPEHQ